MSRPKAIISVSDKTGVVEFARGLLELGFEVITTGGTMKSLADAGVAVRAVSDFTGVPEILGGRVKTLHPSIFGGILARRDNAGDIETLRSHGMSEIQVVAVNLYPFEKTAARADAADHEIVEQIDIGGPSLLRAAAKNHADVFAVVDPADYPEVLRALGDGHGPEGLALRRHLAAKVFERCAAYDTAISSYLHKDARGVERHDSGEMPPTLNINWPRSQALRYGENPHQSAAFYADPSQPGPNLARCRQIQGKELSYNNYLDGDAALEMVRDFDEPAAVILKHANPCGVGVGQTQLMAYQRALAGDPVSAFGGIVGLNRPVDAETAHAMSELFLEVIIAPSFEPGAVEALGKKKNLRLLETGPMTPRLAVPSYRTVSGGILAQMTDAGDPARDAMTVVSKAQPDAEDWKGLLFAWRVARWVKSNAIVYATANRVLGVGAGQMSRIDSARFGLMKAESQDAAALRGCYLASDGFFPFRDVVDLVAAAGVKAIIQPGGSVRDDESIQAADEHGIVMVITGQRRFRH